MMMYAIYKYVYVCNDMLMYYSYIYLVCLQLACDELVDKKFTLAFLLFYVYVETDT